MKLKNIQRVSLVIGFLLLIYIISRIDYSQLSINNFNWDIKIITFILLLTFFLFIIRTVRWNILLKAANIKSNFLKTYVITASSMALSIFTPAQSGDIMKIEFLKSKHSVKRRESISTLILEKAQDLGTLGIIFLVFLIYQGRELLDLNYPVIIIIISFLLVTSIISINILQNKFDSVKTVINSFKNLLKKPKILILSLIATFIYWLSNGLIWLLLAKMVNIHINFITILFVLSGAAIFGLITLIPGAIGAMEASSALLITLLTSYPLSQAVLLGLMVRLLDVIIFIIGYAHIFLLKKEF